MKHARIFKRILCLTLVLVLLVLGAMPALAASNPSGSYVVNATKLYLRKGPGTDYSALGLLRKGAVVTYQSKKGNWWKVNTTLGVGYVYSKYLTQSVTTPNTTTYYVTTVNLKVRSKASIKGAILGKLKRGTKVAYVRQSGGWTYISYNGNTGWVYSKYLKLSN